MKPRMKETYIVVLCESDAVKAETLSFDLREFGTYCDAYVWIREHGTNYADSPVVSVYRWFRIEQRFVFVK